MTTEGSLLDAPVGIYHADQIADQPTLSASIAHILCTSTPLHAWTAHPRLNPDYARTDKTIFDLGTVAHALLLQGLEVAEIIDAPDWRTKDAKEARDAARSAGKVPLLARQYDDVKAMVDAAWRQLDGRQYLPIPFCDGKPEQTIVWDEAGVKCRALIDWLHDDGFCVSDYKTTSGSADPARWRKTAYQIGADVQVAFHSRGVEAACGRRPEWRYVVQETYPPYALSVVSLAPDAVALAEEKVDQALETWKRCLEADRWPAYPWDVAFIEAPSWSVVEWMEREAA